MASVAEHYDRHLGPVYSWMAGDFEASVALATEELRAADIAPGRGEVVVELGCGPGAHAVALGRVGATVVAVDRCAGLLDELRQRAQGLDVRAVHADLAGFRDHLGGAKAAAVLCMGDTLTHLPSEAAVAGLLREAAAVLRPGGIFLATFRDYTGAGPTGPARFIPVRGDADRILTCCIEYGETTVTVTDLLHERHGPAWDFRASSYTKLRLAPASVARVLTEAGLAARTEAGSRGMVRVVGRRP